MPAAVFCFARSAMVGPLAAAPFAMPALELVLDQRLLKASPPFAAGLLVAGLPPVSELEELMPVLLALMPWLCGCVCACTEV